MRRTALLSILTAVTLALTAAPSFAGPAETAFLAKLSNTWSGKGNISGPDGGTIACKLVLTAGGQNLKYQGRCAIPDMAQQAFNGAISYNDKLKRYESRTTGKTVAGVRRGDKLVFTTSGKSMAGTAYTTMTIAANSLTIDFALVDSKTGDKSTSHIVFSK